MYRIHLCASDITAIFSYTFYKRVDFSITSITRQPRLLLIFLVKGSVQREIFEDVFTKAHIMCSLIVFYFVIFKKPLKGSPET
jgi:hypothetical protein